MDPTGTKWAQTFQDRRSPSADPIQPNFIYKAHLKTTVDSFVLYTQKKNNHKP